MASSGPTRRDRPCEAQLLPRVAAARDQAAVPPAAVVSATRMRLKEILNRLNSSFRSVFTATQAMIWWPRFSLTSFRMVSGLVRQGIVASTVLDIGANTGQFAVAAAKLMHAKEVHCFEPHPACQQTLSRLRAGLPCLVLHPCGLGEQPGVLDFHMNAHSHSSSFLRLGEKHRQAFPAAREVSVIPVRVSTLDDECAGLQLAEPVLIKIDVQGFEPAVIRGARATLSRVEYVVVETSLRNLYDGEMLFPEFMTLMNSFGFDFARPVGFLADPRTAEILQIDALFVRSKL